MPERVIPSAWALRRRFAAAQKDNLLDDVLVAHAVYDDVAALLGCKVHHIMDDVVGRGQRVVAPLLCSTLGYILIELYQRASSSVPRAVAQDLRP